MLLLFKAMELQNRFAPLPQKLHIAFCVFATVFFIFCYLRYRRLSDILWMLICDITLILQFYGDKYTALTVVAEPAEGYRLDQILVNGEPIEGTTFVIEDDTEVPLPSPTKRASYIPAVTTRFRRT